MKRGLFGIFSRLILIEHRMDNIDRTNDMVKSVVKDCITKERYEKNLHEIKQKTDEILFLQSEVAWLKGHIMGIEEAIQRMNAKMEAPDFDDPTQKNPKTGKYSYKAARKLIKSEDDD